MSDKKEVQNRFDIDVKEFRVLSTVNGNVIASKVEDLGFGILKILHPYWLILDLEEGSLEFMSLDIWNTEDHVKISKDKVLFQTPVNHQFSVEFRECLKQRFLDDSKEEVSEKVKGTSNVVFLMDRSKFN